VAALDQGVLLRRAWTRTANDGREMACALAWMSREVRQAERTDACPATLMPSWAAEMMPWLDDAPSETAWPGIMRRLGALIDRTTPETWTRRLQATWCRIAVEEAMRHADEAAALAACRDVMALLDRAIAGDEPSTDEWTVVTAAANAAAAAWAAAWAAANAAANAAAAAWAAAAWAAAATAQAAAWAAAWAAANAAAWAAAAAAWAAAKAAATAAADRMAAAILDALEAEIELQAMEVRP
jgi:hypothetical protein